MINQGIRLLIQRVKNARVDVEGRTVGQINQGLLVFIGVGEGASQEAVDWLVQKLSGLRIFPDKEGKMNLSVIDTGGQVLLVSQFTLHASTKKGYRPSFTRAAKPEEAQKWMQIFGRKLGEKIGQEKLAFGEFGAMMDVHLVNDGPVTIWLNSQDRQ